MILKTRHPLFITTVACTVVAVATALIGMTLSHPTLISLGTESGFVENMAAIMFETAALLGGYAWFRNRATGWFVFAGLLLAATLRELDWHSKWTTMSVLKLRFYTSPEVMGTEKAIGAIIILLLVMAAIYALRRVPSSLKSLWTGNWPVTLIYAGLGFLVVAKELDALFRLFPGLEPLRPQYGDLFRYCEETFEVYAGICLALAATAQIQINRN